MVVHPEVTDVDCKHLVYRVSKNDTLLACYKLNKHLAILIITLAEMSLSKNASKRYFIIHLIRFCVGKQKTWK